MSKINVVTCYADSQGRIWQTQEEAEAAERDAAKRDMIWQWSIDQVRKSEDHDPSQRAVKRVFNLIVKWEEERARLEGDDVPF